MTTTSLTRTERTLADGREIIYYDERSGVVRGDTDRRGIARTATAPEMRYDPLQEEWVVFAAHRQGRTHLPPSAECPLCPSTPGRATEIPAADYDVVVFENQFPSLVSSVDTGPDLPATDVDRSERRQAVGRCEVVCFTSDHDLSFAGLSARRARSVIDVWADRTTQLAALPHVEQVFCFENRGEEIGVTLHHPHGQIYAYPFLTPRTRRDLDSARRHRDRTWRNLFADVLAAEQAARVRIVARTEHWTAFVPVAARWPVEVHLYPNRRAPDLPALTDAERDDLAVLYLDVLGRLDRLYDRPLPYVAAWHQAPTRTDRDLAYLHLEVFSVRRAPDKLKHLAGSESAMGVFVSDVLPEDVARRLREV